MRKIFLVLSLLLMAVPLFANDCPLKKNNHYQHITPHQYYPSNVPAYPYPPVYVPNGYMLVPIPQEKECPCKAKQMEENTTKFHHNSEIKRFKDRIKEYKDDRFERK